MVIVDIPGANALYEKLRDQVVIIYIETSRAIRKSRMLSRGDLPSVVEGRIAHDADQFDPKQLHHIDMILSNNEQTLEAIASLVAQYYDNRLE